MNKYLYILPFKDGKYFKIGVSSKNFSRIKKHNNNYGIKYSESLIITAKPSVISGFEKELLCIFPYEKTPYDKDGYTEIRNIKYLSEVIKILSNKHKSLNVNIQKYEDFKPNKNKNLSNKINKKSEIEFISSCNRFILELLNIKDNILKVYYEDNFWVIETSPCEINKLKIKIPLKYSKNYQYYGMVGLEKFKEKFKIRLFLEPHEWLDDFHQIQLYEVINYVYDLAKI